MGVPVGPAAVIVGGTRGIGLAMARKWLELQVQNKSSGASLFVLGRSVSPQNEELQNLTAEYHGCGCRVQPVYADVTQPETISKAAAYVAHETNKTLDYVFHTAGMLHNIASDGKQMEGKPVLPEKTFRDITLGGMVQTFTLNTFGPALVIKEFSPLLKNGFRKGYRMRETGRPPVLAALSARVSSLNDNRKGGWTSYRASKAALNMMLLNAHREFGAGGGGQKVVVLGLHPGTVDTALSVPFQASARKQYNILSAGESAGMLVEFCTHARAEHSGALYAYDGQKIPW